MKSKQILLLILFISTSIFSQSTTQLDKIKQQDLKDDLYELAGDAFRGRRRRSEMRASVWVAQRPVKLVLSLQVKMELLPVFNPKQTCGK
jgi:hypothetical protein